MLLGNVEIVFSSQEVSEETSLIGGVIFELLFVGFEFVFEPVLLGEEIRDTEET